MAYHVDPTQCIGCGLCVSIDDAVYTMTDAGVAEVTDQPEAQEHLELAREALQSCPVAAIYED